LVRYVEGPEADIERAEDAELRAIIEARVASGRFAPGSLSVIEEIEHDSDTRFVMRETLYTIFEADTLDIIDPLRGALARRIPYYVKRHHFCLRSTDVRPND